MHSRDELIKVAVRIDKLRTELNEKQTELTQAEAQFDFLLGEKPNGKGRTPMTDRIVELLIQQPDRVFKVPDVLRGIPEAHEDSVRSALPKLAAAGRIVNSSRGLYHANNGPAGVSPDYDADEAEHHLAEQLAKEEESFAED